LDEWRLVVAELDVSTKLDAIEVASAKLIGDIELAGGSVLRA
jgi:hypothetical protein